MNPPENGRSTDALFPDSYLLRALDLYNWGPFAGRHHVDIDPRGTAIIGATGSGKTTLVDAFMTLLCERPRYNLASTGGHESDRDWVSYVRGKTGEGNNQDDRHIARPGKTVSAVAAEFHNGAQAVQIGGVYWLEGASSSQADLKRAWIFNQSDRRELDEWLELHQQGGFRALRQQQKQIPHFSVTNNKKTYLAQLQRFFGVGDRAFTLLNRAAGLKQLDSIDVLFRDLVLEDNAVFERAAEVVQGFDNLTTIHEELVIARRQRDALLPIEKDWKKHQGLSVRRAEQQRLCAGLPVWFAERRHAWLTAQGEAIRRRIEALAADIEDLEQQAQRAEQEAQTHQTAYLSAGGGDLEEWQRTLERLRPEHRDTVAEAERYRKAMRRFELDDALDPRVFAANQIKLGEKAEALAHTLEADKEPWHQAITEVHNLKREHRENQEAFEQVSARPSSNLPPQHQRFRQALAQHLHLEEDALPFLAELVQVKAEHAPWRGAIERAIGAHRLRILVPATHMQAALRWVNDRPHRLDVRLLEVATEDRRFTEFMADGFVRKLAFKPHPHRQAAKALLAGIDRHCVDAPEVLRETPHGLTREGMMSGKKGYFEKRDKTPLNENWMTGFDNRDRLAQLQRALREGAQALQAASQRQEAAEQRVKQIEADIALLKALCELPYERIDVARRAREIDDYEARIARMQDPDSDLEQARQRWLQAQALGKRLSRAWAEKRAEHTSEEKQRNRVERRKEQALQDIGPGLESEERHWLDERLTLPEEADWDALQQGEKNHLQAVHEAINALDEKLKQCESNLVRQMGKAKHEDTGALAEVGTELRDIEEYRNRLHMLIQEALPEKEQHFLGYLRHSSDQGVTQLLSSVAHEVAAIEERIEELNATMQRVDFQPGRYLRLQPQRVQHASIRELDKAQRHLNSARLKEDGGESHYKALQTVVGLVRDAAENRRKLGSRALLDPRHRLQFTASILDRAENRVINTIKGSQGGSGGEKEIIASYILTASLSYALCPQGANRPLFGTIVLDEAFSKSSQAVAGRIVSALREFGLHPLFVTPNKEMQLLRTHTRSAVLIHRKGMAATTTMLSWEQLQERAEQARAAHRPTP